MLPVEVPMPIYEYHCKGCGEFEVMQKITDAPLTRCPTCHKKVTKLISNTSFQLKGSGWYVTDYARKGGKLKDTGKEPASETSTEGKAKQSGAAAKSKDTKAKEAAAA
jgi:putative FmdB family regulatory protein